MLVFQHGSYGHAFSILAGGYVSDARLSPGAVCAYCELGEVSGRHHEWWVCPAHSPPPVPTVAAAELLCWPDQDQAASHERIAHVVALRKRRLKDRYH